MLTLLTLDRLRELTQVPTSSMMGIDMFRPQEHPPQSLVQIPAHLP
jgi:hypothetical protein